jgi:hypothetical protein
MAIPRAEEQRHALLGRRISIDNRDNRFPMSSLLPDRVVPRTRRFWWPSGWWGNQGYTSQCVGYAWAHWKADGPVTRSPRVSPIIHPSVIYREAKKVDEWPGEDYDGTSIRAGAKVLMANGHISSYRWAWDADTILDTILHVGPVVVGTWWYGDMFHPDSRGVVRVGGRRYGGHAYLVNGINTTTRMLRCKNSWGRDWGRLGYFWVSFGDFQRLIDESGEGVIALDATKPASR